MKFIDKWKFHIGDSVKLVTTKIKEWKPRKCSTEKDYENSLYAFLHEEMGDLQVTKQYAKGRIRADLVVADKVIVELKNNLNTTAKYQRLIGQLNLYKQWDGRIIVLLTGDTDTNLRKQLDSYLKSEELAGDIFDDAKVTIYQK
jgi:hypothetical protein